MPLPKTFAALTALLTLAALTLGVSAGQTVPAAQTQGGMNAAAGKDFAKADAEMNVAYKKLIASVDAKAQSKLRTSQRLWLKFRDAEAEFRSMKVKGGSVYPMVYDNNKAAITRARTRELNDAYKTFHTEGMM